MEKTLKIKIIIIGGGVLLILCLILLFSTGTDKESKNAIDSYNSAKQNESQVLKDADYWLNYDEKTAGSSTGTLITDQTAEADLDVTASETNKEPLLSDITDDEDLLLMQTQQQIRNSNLENRQQAHPYTPVTNKTQTPVSSPKMVNAIGPQVPAQAPLKKNEEPKQAATPQVEVQEPDEPEIKTNRFYTGRRRTQKGNTISAVVQGEQTVMQGSTIKLRLLEDMKTETGVTIPKGASIWGVVTISSERLLVNISSVLLGKDLVPIKRTVYDIDGQKGINLPPNVKAEIAKRAEAQSIQNAPTDEITSGGGILEKSAGAVVNTAKGLLSRKAEEIKVTIKSNYQIVLK
jgi:conjugative transposon TraM protein